MTRSFGDECASRVGVNAEPGKYLSISCKIYYVKNKTPNFESQVNNII